jgi:hypothetical protein
MSRSLERAGVGPDSRYLDAAVPLLAIARSRVPQDDVQTGDLEMVPFADRTLRRTPASSTVMNGPLSLNQRSP